MVTITVVRVNGQEEQLQVSSVDIFPRIETLIAAWGLDKVNLRNGTIMWVDDMGAHRQTPVNARATALYHSVCLPGTTWPIRGDVVITPIDWSDDDAHGNENADA